MFSGSQSVEELHALHTVMSKCLNRPFGRNLTLATKKKQFEAEILSILLEVVE